MPTKLHTGKKKQTNGHQNHNPTERKKKNESQVAIITPSNTIRPKTGGKRVKQKKKKKGGISLTGEYFFFAFSRTPYWLIVKEEAKIMVGHPSLIFDEAGVSEGTGIRHSKKQDDNDRHAAAAAPPG